MARLIDVDTLRKDFKVAERCDNCPQYNRDCNADVVFSRVDICVILDDAPIVDAEPVRHGRWVKMTGMLPPEYHGHYCCSECEWHMKGLRNSWTREEELLYCPNCGAKMEEDNEDD